MVIDCEGIGYFVHVPESVVNSLPDEGSKCRLYTILNITKTEIFLVGFLTAEQRSCFRMLTEVSGAGTKAGLEILGTLDVQMLYQTILSEDVKILTQVKGIGKKLAQRIILECHDKIEGKAVEGLSPNSMENGSAVLSAIEALMSLGYKQKEAAKAVADIDSTLPLETIVSQALKKFTF